MQVYLRLSDGAESTCEIQGQVLDTHIVCTLPMKKGSRHNGLLVVSVGTDWSGGQQNTSTGAHSKIKEMDPPAPVTVTVMKDISEIASGSPEEAMFVASFVTDISKAVGIPQERIRVISIKAGSVIVEFEILPDPMSIISLSPASVAADIVKQASNPSVRAAHAHIYAIMFRNASSR